MFRLGSLRDPRLLEPSGIGRGSGS